MFPQHNRSPKGLRVFSEYIYDAQSGKKWQISLQSV